MFSFFSLHPDIRAQAQINPTRLLAPVYRSSNTGAGQSASASADTCRMQLWIWNVLGLALMLHSPACHLERVDWRWNTQLRSGRRCRWNSKLQNYLDLSIKFEATRCPGPRPGHLVLDLGYLIFHCRGSKSTPTQERWRPIAAWSCARWPGVVLARRSFTFRRCGNVRIQ